MKRAVITGPTGCIGRALVDLCIKNGYDVLAVVNPDSKRTETLKKKEHFQVMELGLDDYESAMEEVSRQDIDVTDCHIFFHLAWMGSYGKGRDNLELQLKNIEGALRAVEFAQKLGCRIFVGVGSQAEYGRTDNTLLPDTPTFPETGYGAAKLCAGQMTRLRCRQLGMKHVWCRVLSVYGPYDRPETLISTAVKRMSAGEDTRFTPCEQVWDYIYSEDAARAILTAAEKGTDGQTFLVGSAASRPLKEYVEEIARITEYNKEIGFGKIPYNDKQVMHLEADITALKELGFTPEISFEEGIKRTIATS